MDFVLLLIYNITDLEKVVWAQIGHFVSGDPPKTQIWPYLHIRYFKRCITLLIGLFCTSWLFFGKFGFYSKFHFQSLIDFMIKS